MNYCAWITILPIFVCKCFFVYLKKILYLCFNPLDVRKVMKEKLQIGQKKFKRKSEFKDIPTNTDKERRRTPYIKLWSTPPTEKCRDTMFYIMSYLISFLLNFIWLFWQTILCAFSMKLLCMKLVAAIQGHAIS